MTTTTTFIRPPARRRRWVSWLLGFFIFVAGLCVGTALTVIFAIGALKFAFHHPENAPSRITAMLTPKLHLDADQRAKVLAIMTQHQVQVQAIRRQMRPQFDQQLDQIRAEVSGVLTDEQRVEWQHFFDELRERWTPSLLPPPATAK